jgi:hypothetical protein
MKTKAHLQSHRCPKCHRSIRGPGYYRHAVVCGRSPQTRKRSRPKPKRVARRPVPVAEPGTVSLLTTLIRRIVDDEFRAMLVG